MILTNNGALTIDARAVNTSDVVYQGGIAVRASTGAVYVFGNTPAVLVQSAIPFILAGGTAGGSSNQFTMGNNGALSTLPVLPTTYSGGGFIYMPASGIFAGSTAGWYWFVASSTTAGTVYNNTYTSGDPRLAVPSSPTAFASTGPGVVTQTTAADIQGPAIVLTGGSLGPNGSLFGEVGGASIVNGNTKGGRIKMGATNIGYQDVTSSGGFLLTARAANRNSQAINMNYVNAGSGGGTNLVNAAPTYTTINTAADQTISMAAYLGVATDYVVMERFRVVVEYGA